MYIYHIYSKHELIKQQIPRQKFRKIQMIASYSINDYKQKYP